MTTHGNSRRRDWWWALFVLILYAFPFPYFEILRSPNELSRVYQVRALVDDHTTAVNASVRRYGPVGDLSQYRGRMFPNKAPGISFLGAPIYFVVRLLAGGAAQVTNRALTYILRILLCALPTALLLVPLIRYARRMSGDDRAAEAAILVYAFGSLATPYSLLFFSHQLSAVLVAVAFLAIERSKRDSRWWWPFLGGLAAAYAVVTEYPTAVVAATLGFYTLFASRRRLSSALLFIAGALPCAFLLAAYHQDAYGSPFSTGYAHVQSQVFASWHKQGFMGVTTPKLSSLLGNLFSPARGLFAFAPAFLFAMPGLGLLFRKSRSDAVVAVAVMLFYFFLAAAFLYQAWGWMLGPRHLTPLIPFLVAPLACMIAWWRQKASVWLGIVAGLCASSVLVTSVCTAVYPHIPDEFSAAVAHLVWPLLSTGHLPYNMVDELTGHITRWTWIPWFISVGVIAISAAWLCLSRIKRPPFAAMATLALAGHVAILFLAVPAPNLQERTTLSWIERTWEPAAERR